MLGLSSAAGEQSLALSRLWSVGSNMMRFRVSGRTVSICGAAALLAACGGVQLPSGAARGVPASGITGRSHSDYDITGPLLYVTNIIAWTVTIYHTSARNPAPIAIITQGLDAPAGACVDSQGTLYVTNQPISGPGWISEYPLGRATPSEMITKGINTAAYCATDSNGNLWVTNIGGRNATEYPHGSKKPSTVITQDMIYPTGIAIDPSGNLYVSNRLRSGGDVVVFSPGSTAPHRVITDGITSPVALAIDASGDLYATNVTENNVEEYLPGGDHPFRTITRGLNTPGGMTVDKKGWLFAANFEPDTVVEFQPGSSRPSRRKISKGVRAPDGLAIYPAVLP
jgi:hypothetical protein